MNRRMIFYMVGNIILLEAALLILPALVALCYQEMNGVFSFSLTIIIAALTGGAMKLIFKPSNRVIYAREGFIIKLDASDGSWMGATTSMEAFPTINAQGTSAPS